MSQRKRIFVENTWYAAAWTYEVEEADNKLARTICEKPLLFYKTDSGRFVALDNRCCHRSAPLALGRIEGECIRCMYHGILFDSDGKGLEIPAQTRVSDSIKVRNYPLVEKGGMLWIWMGDPELADENDIVDFPALSDPAWRGFDKPAYLHYDANWLLIVDNLSDFSHVAYVHTHTLGGSEDYAYQSELDEIIKLDNGFKVDRWHHGSGVPPFYAKVIPESEHKDKVDRCNATAMYIPGVFVMETLFAPAGWDKQANNRDECREFRNCQFMTPETRNTSHFFWNYLHKHDIDNPTISKSLYDSLLEGFMEDKIFIEEQQKLLEKSPDFVPKTIGADEAFTYFRTVWSKRLREEDEANPIVEKENKRRIL